MFLCPKCKESLQDGVKFCTSCGVEIAKVKKTFYCPFCGKENEEGTRICVWCKEKIVNQNVLNKNVDIFTDGGLGNIDFAKIEQDAIEVLAEEYGIKYRKVYDERMITQYRRREDVFIPKYFIGICQKTFIRDPEIKSLIIEEGVEIIGEEAFQDCINLKKVQLPSTIKSIGLRAFDGVYLDTIILSNPTPQSFKLIVQNCCNKEIYKDIRLALDIPAYEKDTFFSRTLSKIKTYSRIENDLEIIDLKKFREDMKSKADKKREEIKKRDEIEKEFSILNGVLYTYRGYSSNIVLHESITEISSNVFKKYIYGKDILTMFLPSNLTKIGASAFENLKKLKRIDFPETLETIDEKAFSSCVKLENIKFNKKLNKIGVGAFEGCKSLKEASIPSVTILEKSLFYNCIKLEKVECPNVEVINEAAFQNCQSLKTIDTKKVKEIKDSAFENCESLDNIDIKNVIEINASIFSRCTKIKEITLNSNVNVIEKFAFNSCWSLEKINLENIKEIKEDAFSSCLNLKNVNLSRIEKIGARAFMNSGLKELIIPESVKEISDYAFASCGALKKLVLPESLEKIGASSFNGLKSIEYIIIPKNVTEIGTFAFGESRKKDCPSLKVIYIPKGRKFKTLPKGVKVKKYKIDDITKIKEKLERRT